MCTRVSVKDGEKGVMGFFSLMYATEEDLPERLWILNGLKELQGHCSGC